MLFASTAIVNGQATHYFSTLAFAESPLPYPKGSVALEKEKALSRNHYRFTYDKSGKLRSIGFFIGSVRRAPNHTANLFFPSSELRFTWSEGKEEIRYFDRFGNPVTVRGEVFRSVYSLDTLGIRVGLHFENEAGAEIENSWGISRYSWLHQADGSIIEERYNKEGELQPIRPGFEFHRVRLYYNANGYIALMQNIDAASDLVENSSGAAQDRIITNAEGHFLGWRVWDKNGVPEKGNSPDVASGNTGHDTYGYEISTRNEDEAGRPIYNTYGICRSTTTYDAFGNMLSRTFLDENGNPAPHGNAGYVSFRMQWGEDGMNRLGMEYHDREGRLTEHSQRGYARVKQEYDASGNLLKISYFDRHGQLVNRKDRGYAYRVFQYDAANRQVEVKSYTNEGEWIEK